MKKKINLWFLIIFSVIFSIAGAEDFNFKTTKEEIIEVLTQPEAQQRPKTRTINGSEITKTRGIIIVTEENGGTVGKTIYLSEKTKQGVNLKIKFDFDSYAILSESFALIDELGIDFIVMGNKGKKSSIPIFLGSTATKTLHTVKKCPVLTVPLDR